MPEPLETDSDFTHAVRARRLVQISSLVLVILLAGMVPYVHQGRWEVVGPLACAAVMMGVCQALNRTGRTELANAILLVSLMLMSSTLMWLGRGLQDPIVLTYPVIMIMGGLLMHKRAYIAMLVGMLVFLVFLTVATQIYGLRVDKPPAAQFSLMRDVILILIVGGVSVWVMVADLHNAFARLQVQMTKSRESQNRLAYITQHDVLTGLPNRALERDRIEHALAHATRRHLRLAFLFVDLDQFKAVNDSLGHAMGDELLQMVATRLSHSVRKSDIVTRHGGDEFVIGLTDVGDAQDVSTAASKVIGCLKDPLVARGTEVLTSCSIGIALFPDDADDYESLLRQSGVAMNQAKESGRNAFRFYDAAMNDKVLQNLRLVSDLRIALSRNEFVLHYQPVMDLATGRLVGAEALVRWQHPETGLVPPMQFIPAAEKSGLIVEMGAWVLEEACRQLVEWQALGCEDFVMAVNLSPVQFRRGDIEKVVEDALKRTGLAPACLELEITESTLIQDTEKFIESLQRLKALGVKISIDDFGTGYSNLSYLQRFAVDKLKIDQSFVMRLQKGPQDRAMVTAIIQMAKSLNMRTTAEGIEVEAVRQELVGMGCGLGQGYYFARPLPADKFFGHMRQLHESQV
jgi:diguanylate cyclase (GGDEF)-like protein